MTRALTETLPSSAEELDVIRPVPNAGLFFQVFPGPTKRVFWVRYPIGRRVPRAGVSRDRGHDNLFINLPVGGHEHRLELEQALVAVSPGDALPHDEGEQETRAAGELRVLEMPDRRQPAEVVGTDILEHRVDVRVAQGEKLRVGAVDGQFSLKRGVAVALQQTSRAQDIRNQELEEGVFPLELAPVPGQEAFRKRLQVVQRQVRRQLAR